MDLSRRRLEWTNGAVAYAFSAEDPESLRGPQFGCAWSDEMAKWRYAQGDVRHAAIRFAARQQPRQLITTTPRPTALIKRLMLEPTSVVTRAATQANAYHLAPTFLKGVLARYKERGSDGRNWTARSSRIGPTRCGRARCIENCRVTEAPPLARIVVAVDPPASSASAPTPAALSRRGSRARAAFM